MLLASGGAWRLGEAGGMICGLLFTFERFRFGGLYVTVLPSTWYRDAACEMQTPACQADLH